MTNKKLKKEKEKEDFDDDDCEVCKLMSLSFPKILCFFFIF